MSWPNNWTDEEFINRQASLDKVLNNHLGPPAEVSDPLDAEFVMMAFWLPAAGTEAVKPDQERIKLQKVERLAREFTAAWTELANETEYHMRRVHTYEAKGRHGEYSSNDPFGWSWLCALDGIVSAAAPRAYQYIDTAPTVGRRNLLNVSIVEGLRHVWQQRKGTEAPRSMTEAGPFADFMFDAFEALGLSSNPRAAVDSWREFRARHPDSP